MSAINTWGVEVQIRFFLASAIDEVGGRIYAPAALLHGKEHPLPVQYDAVWTSRDGLDSFSVLCLLDRASLW